MRAKSHHFDYVLLIVSAFLIIIGISVLAGTSASISQKNFGSTTYILIHQIKFGILPGILFGGLCFFLPLRILKKWSPIALMVILLMMGMVFLPKIGLSLGGASRWVNLGLISFQPSEFLKIGFVIYLAAWISNREFKSSSFSKTKFTLRTFTSFFEKTGVVRLLIPFLIIIGMVSLLLIFQPDISTLGIIILTAILMYFAANTRLSHTIFLILAGIAALIGLITIASYRLNRLLTFLKMGMDPMGMGYQINQALIAIGSGRIWGRGMGMGIQKYGFLPQSISDSIFAVFAEETGFIGSLFLITLFLVFARQGFKISKKASNKFFQILALGITSWIVIQGFVNIGSIAGILPLTGIPLPFISYGGSHLIAELMGVGILLNISRYSNKS